MRRIGFVVLKDLTFDVEITQAGDSFAEFSESGSNYTTSIVVSPHVFSKTNGGTSQKMYRRGETILKYSAPMFRRLFSVVTKYSTQSCYRIFKREATSCEIDVEKILSVDILDHTCAGF